MKHSTAWTSGTNSNDLRLSGLTPGQTQRVRDDRFGRYEVRALEEFVDVVDELLSRPTRRDRPRC